MLSWLEKNEQYKAIWQSLAKSALLQHIHTYRLVESHQKLYNFHKLCLHGLSFIYYTFLPLNQPAIYCKVRLLSNLQPSQVLRHIEFVRSNVIPASIAISAWGDKQKFNDLCQ